MDESFDLEYDFRIAYAMLEHKHMRKFQLFFMADRGGMHKERVREREKSSNEISTNCVLYFFFLFAHKIFSGFL